MITIQWKGKIGYGDILSPICYAHNVSYQLRCTTKLVFKWGKPAEYKYNDKDPETLWERADYLTKLCSKKQNSVIVEHDFEHSLRVNHTNYDWDVVGTDVFHNYWFPEKKNNNESNIIVVNPTILNTVSLKSLKRGWKDPMCDNWYKIIDTLARKHTVRVVDYRTPIREAVDLLMKAKGLVGYHGGLAWVAKLCHTPALLFADGGSLTRNAFPYHAIETGIEQFQDKLEIVDKFFGWSRKKIDGVEARYQTYKMSPKFMKSLSHDA